MTLTDPLALLLQMPHGSALYSRVQFDGGHWEVAWILREEKARLRQLGKEPPVEFRAGVFVQDGVLLIPVLVRVGKVAPENIFETWVNVCQAGGNGPDVVKDLAAQERIAIQFYDSRPEPERSLQIYNSMRSFFESLTEQLQIVTPWTMRQFDQAREQIYKRYPEIMDLWRGLK